MRYGDLVRMFAPVPVTSPPLRQDAPASAAPPAPAPGARWGKASAFSWSNAAAAGGRSRTAGVTVDYPEPEPREFMRVVTADLRVRSERVRVEGPSGWVDVDRMTRMAFQFTEFPPKRQVGSLQPSRTTVYDLEFDLHPPTSDEAPPP